MPPPHPSLLTSACPWTIELLPLTRSVVLHRSHQSLDLLQSRRCTAASLGIRACYRAKQVITCSPDDNTARPSPTYPRCAMWPRLAPLLTLHLYPVPLPRGGHALGVCPACTVFCLPWLWPSPAPSLLPLTAAASVAVPAPL